MRGRRIAAGLAIGLAVGGFALDRWIDTADLPPLEAPFSTVVTDAEGAPLRVFLAADDRWRLPVGAERVDAGFLVQLIAYEDRRFWSHPGVDPLALARAALDSLLAGRIVSGGSTLTMQVARLIDGGGTGQWRGKLRQIRLALALERRLSKAEILQIYLTRAPYGGNIEGVRAASMSWFGKDAHRLSPGEAALLVALPQAPEARRPDRAPLVAERARNGVLARAAALGVLDPTVLPHAMAEPVPRRRTPFPEHAWHLAGRAVAEDPAAPVHRLPVDLKMQIGLEHVLAAAAGRLPPGVSAAGIVIDHRSGRLVAHAGAALPGATARGGFIDMSRAVRSPGSALKPFVYALAFADGRAHPETRLEDRPTDFGGYAPVNFDGGYRGAVSAREALQLSLNVPAVALLDEIGPARLTAFLRRAGAVPRTAGDAAPGLAAALGGLGLSLEDLARLYAVLARGGVDGGGDRLLGAAAAWQVSDILRGAPVPGLAPSGRIAFKTGTSYGYRDAWAIGHDGAHVVAIWAGRPDAAAVPGLSGFETAAPLMFEVFARIEGGLVPLPPPPSDVLLVSHAELPAPLRQLGPVRRPAKADAVPLALVYPPDGAVLVLSGRGAAARLVAKVQDGRAPFTWMVDGAVVPWDPMARSFVWTPDGPGHVTVTVLDRFGHAARAGVELRLD
ncbi:penicillin-binding protein 1C [Halovulum dunhuangense]|uniref:peptidoglycan glycosyltransferase n=1 Tax=Halovulum dunhuangense TaxID=1505036 RepID=A0A849L5J5_9RHOB|nr:penicillin-binding protein 1C [Halovulum dunhuangense]NNU81444.1 penicillin-binding protein 1C [Halovulum dunhuangense]